MNFADNSFITYRDSNRHILQSIVHVREDIEALHSRTEAMMRFLISACPSCGGRGWRKHPEREPDCDVCLELRELMR
jgi:hypothetical protein